MQRNRGGRIIPLFIAGLVIILIIAGAVSLLRAVFGGEDATQTKDSTDVGRTQLLDTRDGSSVQLTVRGPIVAEEEHRSYQVTVSPISRVMVIYRGYLDEELKSKGLENNREAYEQFVYALDKANMMKGDVPENDDQNDLRGICATGYVYEYTVLQGGSSVKRLWSSTCSGSKGSLDASVSQLNNLFLNQIPESEKLVPFSSSQFELRF